MATEQVVLEIHDKQLTFWCQRWLLNNQPLKYKAIALFSAPKALFLWCRGNSRLLGNSANTDTSVRHRGGIGVSPGTSIPPLKQTNKQTKPLCLANAPALSWNMNFYNLKILKNRQQELLEQEKLYFAVMSRVITRPLCCLPLPHNEKFDTILFHFETFLLRMKEWSLVEVG